MQIQLLMYQLSPSAIVKMLRIHMLIITIFRYQIGSWIERGMPSSVVCIYMLICAFDSARVCELCLWDLVCACVCMYVYIYLYTNAFVSWCNHLTKQCYCIFFFFFSARSSAYFPIFFFLYYFVFFFFFFLHHSSCWLASIQRFFIYIIKFLPFFYTFPCIYLIGIVIIAFSLNGRGGRDLSWQCHMPSCFQPTARPRWKIKKNEFISIMIFHG